MSIFIISFALFLHVAYIPYNLHYIHLLRNYFTVNSTHIVKLMEYMQ